MKRTLIAKVLIAFLLLPTTGLAQTSSPVPLRTALNIAELATRLDQMIPRLMRDGDVPGLAVAVIDDGKVVWNRRLWSEERGHEAIQFTD